LVGNSIVVPLGGLVVNLFSKFGRHNGAYEAKEEDSDDSSININ
jgi:hypothetical protein